jgi:GNAT superfamily N-acetyltransferase
MDESGLKSRGRVGTFWLARSVEGGDLLGSVYVNASEGDGSAVIGHSGISGYELTPIAGRVGEIGLLSISPALKKQGVGAALLFYAETELEHLGCSAIGVPAFVFTCSSALVRSLNCSRGVACRSTWSA